MTIMIEQYAREFTAIPPSFEELEDVIYYYRTEINDLKDWCGLVQDLWDGKDYLAEWCAEGEDVLLTSLRNQWFWNDDLNYETMFNDIKLCFHYYQQIMNDLIQYKEETFKEAVAA